MKKQNKPFEKLRLAVLFSGSASGLRYLMENDELYGNAYELVGCLTNNSDASALFHPIIGNELLTHVHDYEQWCAENFYSKRDMAGRARYCAELIEYLRLKNPDVILLSGFMLDLTPNFLAAFKNRIIAEPALTQQDGSAIQNALRLLIEGIFTLGEEEQASEPQTIRRETTMVNTFFGPLL